MSALAGAVAWTGPVCAQPDTGAGPALDLTDEEHRWLSEHPVIRVAPDPDFPPFEFFDEAGRYDGIAADYLDLLRSRLGVTFEIVREASWDDVLVKARAGEVDLLAAAVETPQRAEYLAFTQPHIKLHGVIIATTAAAEELTLDDLKDRKVAVVSGYVWQDLLSNDHPEIELVPVPSTSTALQMTAYGLVDAMIGDHATATYFITQEGLTNLRVAGRPGYSDGLALGVRKDWAPLVPILEKALATITPQERAAIQDRWIALEYPSIFARRGFWVTVGSIAVGIFVVIGGILIWNRVLQGKVDQRTKELNDELAWRKEAEEELRKHRDHLDELVHIRTAELSAANDKMRRDLEAAAKLQQSLLPQTAPDVGGVKFAWHYRPCDELAGDIFNVFQLDKKHIGIYVADVSGHGVAASLLSVAISRVLTPEASAGSLLVRPGDDPATLRIVPPLEVANELNRRFPMAANGNKYFTILYGVVNIETREFRYVSAGHPPIVRWAPGKDPETIDLAGMAIGWTDEGDFEERVQILDPGDRLLLYSDGVPEAMDPENKQFGNARLLVALQDNNVGPLETGLEDLLKRIEVWCGKTGPKDDVSLLGVEIG